MESDALLGVVLSMSGPVLVIGMAALISCGALFRHARARAAGVRRPTVGGRLTRPRPRALAVAGLALAIPGVTWGLPDWHWGPGTRTDHWEVGAAPNDSTWHGPGWWEIGAAPDGSEWTVPTAWEIG